MTHYPLEVLEKLVDPFSGLAGRQNKIPTPYDVRCFCEDAVATIARVHALAEHERRQLAERTFDGGDRSSRPTIGEIGEDLARKGVFLPSWQEVHRRHLCITEAEFSRLLEGYRLFCETVTVEDFYAQEKKSSLSLKAG